MLQRLCARRSTSDSGNLRNKRRQDGDKSATFAFYDWIRQSLLANRPYDQFVGEILAFELGIEDLRDEVLGAAVAAVLDDVAPVGVHLAPRLERGRAGEVSRAERFSRAMSSIGLLETSAKL